MKELMLELIYNTYMSLIQQRWANRGAWIACDAFATAVAVAGWSGWTNAICVWTKM